MLKRSLKYEPQKINFNISCRGLSQDLKKANGCVFCYEMMLQLMNVSMEDFPMTSYLKCTL